MRPPHNLFFSSLKQLEKRLKLDEKNPPQPPPSLAGNPQPEISETQATESHNLFFSSLKQVEKRLKLNDENPAPPPPSPAGNPQPETSETQATDFLSNPPIYLCNQPTNTSSTLQDNCTEQPPQEFLSYNNVEGFPASPHESPQSEDSETRFSESSTVDDVDSLMQLLGLSDFDGKRPEMPDFGDDEFYDKIVKVKGPKCKHEVERLEGWIKYLLNNGRREPLRLAHLLLAEAAFVSISSGGGAGLEFPSTIDEYLQNDPPSG